MLCCAGVNGKEEQEDKHGQVQYSRSRMTTAEDLCLYFAPQLTFLTFLAAFADTNGRMQATSALRPPVGRTSRMYLTFLRKGRERLR